MLVTGLGMGRGISALFDTAVGDVDQAEAGRRAGRFSEAQWIAGALGASVITWV